MRELLHPPGHRGPVIAAGAVVLGVGVTLQQERMDWAPGVQCGILAAVAVVFLWLGMQERLDAGPPPGYVSVLVVAGLLAVLGALLRAADGLVDTFTSDPAPGTVAWITGLEALLAAWVSARRRSAVAALIAAVAGGVAVLTLYVEVFDTTSDTPIRWLLLLLAIGYAIASLPLRGNHARHAEQLVNAAGLAVAGIWLGTSFDIFVFEPSLPTFWEGIVLAAGLGLVAYAAVDRVPGAGYLGVLNLFGFVLAATGDEETLLIWPVLLLVLGAVLMAVGLRPRVPLPPPPEASTSPDDQPLAARTDDDDTLRVYRD